MKKTLFVALGFVALFAASPAWAGIIVVDFDFDSANYGGGSLKTHLPLTQTDQIAAGVTVATGAGHGGGMGLSGAGNQGATWYALKSKGQSTLANAITNNHYCLAWTINSSSARDLRDNIFEITYLSFEDNANNLYVLSSIEGFTADKLLGSATGIYDNTQHTLSVTLPSTSAYSSVTGNVEFRVYVTGATSSAQTDSLKVYDTKLITPEPATVGMLAVGFGTILVLRHGSRGCY